jgi:ribosome-associated toxin RatA of RatAB toxin-antitoxin module
MAAAKQFTRYPEFMPNLDRVEILEFDETGPRKSHWVSTVNVGPLKRQFKWTETDSWDDENRNCSFDLVEGDMKTYKGSWSFTPQNDGCLVELKVQFELGIPMLSPMINNIVNQLMQQNCDALLEALDQLCKA